jgi:hypothetical protein
MTATLEAVIDTYCRCWQEMEADERAALLATACADDVTYRDPTGDLVGREALAVHIAEKATARPGATIARVSAVDRHHDVARFGWHLVGADGRTGAPSLDIVTFAPDGRLKTILGFFGPLAPL